MAVRQTGFALLSSASVQEAHDTGGHRPAGDPALPRPVRALLRRVPHQPRGELRRPAQRRRPAGAACPESLVRAHRRRALSPEHPYIRGTAQNPDTYFQGREIGQPLLPRRPGHRGGRPWPSSPSSPDASTTWSSTYGDPEADRVVVIMGSGAQTVAATVEHLNAQGQKVGDRSRSGCTGRSRRRRCWPRSPRPPGWSPSSTAPRSRAPAASRSSSTWPPRSARLTPRALRPTLPAAGRADATACPARSSPRPWWSASSTSSRWRRLGRGSPSASTTTSRCCACPTTRARHRGPDDPARGVLRPRLGRHGRAPTRTPSRSSARSRTPTPRATSSTTPRSRGRGRSRTCGSGRRRSRRPT